MTSICEKKISAEVRLIHAEQMPLYNFIILRKKQWTQMKTKQRKQELFKNTYFEEHLRMTATMFSV